MIINHNMASLNTYNKLSTNTANTAKSLEKLSSGLRINKAGDDAAGLAISEKMRAQIRGLDQASRNSQDAISLMGTAEGALAETQSILQRMRELAVQSATDTNVSADRSEIQKEINQLSSEINRIGNTTEFNTRKLMNGDLAKVINGFSAGKTAVASEVKITDQAIAASVTGTNYGTAGNRNLVATNATSTGAYVLNELSTIQQGVNNELNLEIDGVRHDISVNTVMGSGRDWKTTDAFELDLSADNALIARDMLSVTVDGMATVQVNLATASKDYSAATGAPTTVGDFLQAIENDLNAVSNVDFGDASGKFKVGLINGNIAITNTAKAIQIDSAVEDSLGATTLESDALGVLSDTKLTTGQQADPVYKYTTLSGLAAMEETDDLGIDLTAKDGLKVTVAGIVVDDVVLATAGAADHQLTNIVEWMQMLQDDLNGAAELNVATIGDASGKFKVWLDGDGKIAIGNTVAEVDVTTASTQNAFADIGGGGAATQKTPTPESITGTDNIREVMNFELRSRGIGATVNFDEQSRMQIKTDTLGNAGSVSVIGGGLAVAFIGETSTNSALLSAIAKKDDKISVTLEGASGELHTIDLTAIENKNNPLANQFKEVTTSVPAGSIADQADLIRVALNDAINANEDLKGRYFINLDETGANIKVTGAAVGDGYAISQFTITKSSTGSLEGDAGTAMDATGTTYVEGKDIGDTFTHKDLGASITGSVEMTNTALQKTNIVIEAVNNEFTFNVDNNADTTTIVMDDKTYDGKAQTYATGTVRFVQGVAVADGDDWKLQLKGLDGSAVSINLEAKAVGAIPNNSSTQFIIGTNTSDTVANMADSVARAIAANDKLNGQYEVTVQNGNEITITATKATSELAVLTLDATSTGGFAGAKSVESANQLGDVGRAVETLRDDMQSKIDATVWSTYNDVVASVSTHDADVYKVQLEGADGTMVDLALTSAGTGAGVNDNTSTTFDRDTATVAGNAYNISEALNLAIEANDNLKGRYEAFNLGDTITIKAIDVGDGHEIKGVAETANATFAITQGATADAQRTASATVSIENNRMVLTSDNTAVGSEISIGGSNPALAIFGELSGRVYQGRLAENDTMTLNVDGVNKSVAIASQIYQDVDEFVSVNQNAFNGAGVTASNDNGKLVLTSNVSGKTSVLEGLGGEADILKQIGLQQADGSALTAGQFIKGADGNTTLLVNVDGEDIVANLQQGTYKDINVLAKAVESAINAASTVLTRDVRVTVDDGKLTISSTGFGVNSKIVIGTHESLDAAGVLGLTEREEKTGAEGDSKLNFQIGANQGQSMALSINDMRSQALGVTSATQGFEVEGVENAVYTVITDVTNGTSDENVEYALDVSDHLKAAGAVTVINKAIEAVSAERAKLGAASNRLEHTIANLGTASENLTGAESRIRDVDMAKEMMQFQKNNILAQAATAMLAQANQQPQGVLQLLR